MAALIESWSPAQRAALRRDAFAGRHRFAHAPLFAKPAIIDILDHHDRNFIDVFTCGDDVGRPGSFRRGSLNDLSGADLYAAAEQGRIWLNIRRLPTYSADYGRFLKGLFGELEAMNPGLRTSNLDAKLLVSSPQIAVFYHIDGRDMLLWQIQGEKRFFVYPRQEPFISNADIERIVLKESDEELAFDPTFDADAQVFDLGPGDFAGWPQYTPHRVVNAGVLNVSLVTEYFTHESRFRAGALTTNGLLRRKFGAPAPFPDAITPTVLAKWAAARALRATGLRKDKPAPAAPPSFKVDLSAPDSVRDHVC